PRRRGAACSMLPSAFSSMHPGWPFGPGWRFFSPFCHSIWSATGCATHSIRARVDRPAANSDWPTADHSSQLRRLQATDAVLDYSELSPSDRGMALPAASRNQARKMYHAEFPVSAGIGSAIGNAASTPSMARQPAITNKATLGAYSFMATPDLGLILRAVRFVARMAR